MSTWKENDPNSSPDRNLIYGQVDNGNGTFTSVPIAATINADGLATLATSGSGGGGGGTAATVGGKTGTVVVTPTVSTSAYVNGYVVGGLLTFANALLTAQSGILQSVRVTSKSVQTSGYKLYIFSTQPGTSVWNDHTAPAINAADIGFLVDVIALSGPDSGLGTHTLYAVDGIGKALNAATTSLYGVLVTTGTPTFASTSDITVAINVLQD